MFFRLIVDVDVGVVKIVLFILLPRPVIDFMDGKVAYQRHLLEHFLSALLMLITLHFEPFSIEERVICMFRPSAWFVQIMLKSL